MEGAVRVRDFRVVVNGMEGPTLDVEDLEAPNMGENADDPELSECLVRVEWLKTLPANEQSGRMACMRTITLPPNCATSSPSIGWRSSSALAISSTCSLR